MTRRGEAYIVSPEKRVLDVLGASLLAIGAAPLAGAAALGLCIEQRSTNPFYRQLRLGRNSTPFTVNKLRTLAEHTTTGSFETYGPVDPRATKFANFIRNLGLDEWPQFTNILAGDMGLVGVRPQAPAVLEQRKGVDQPLFEDWYYCYERNPGLFGLGQAYARKAESYSENGEIIRGIMKKDIEAYEHASLENDITTFVSQPLNLMYSALRQPIITH